MSSSSGIRQRVLQGVKASLVGKAIYTVSNALLIVLLTRRLLTTTEFGQLYYALAVLSVVSLFAGLGLPKATARYVTQYAEQAPDQVRFILRRSTLYLTVLVVVVSLALALVSEPLAALLGQPEVAPLLFVGSLYVGCYTFNGYLTILFQGFNRVTWSATMTALSAVSRTVLAVALTAVGFGALGALVGYAAGYAVAAVVGGIVLYRRYYSQFEPTETPEPGLARRVLRYSIPLTATKGAGVVDKRVDAILVGSILNPVAVGYYIVAKQVSDVAALPAASFGFALSPTLGEQTAGDRRDRATHLYEESLRYVLLFYIPAAAGLIVVADPVVRFVFGTDYLPAVPVLQVFGLYVVVQGINRLTSDGLDYLGRAWSRSAAKGAMAGANFGLNLLLIPTFGVVGAAVATVVTHTFYTLANVYIIHQELQFDVGRVFRDVARILGITVGMLLVVVAAEPYVSGPLSLVSIVVVGGVVWFALSVLSGLLELREIKSILW